MPGVLHNTTTHFEGIETNRLMWASRKWHLCFLHLLNTMIRSSTFSSPPLIPWAANQLIPSYFVGRFEARQPRLARVSKFYHGRSFLRAGRGLQRWKVNLRLKNLEYYRLIYLIMTRRICRATFMSSVQGPLSLSIGLKQTKSTSTDKLARSLVIHLRYVPFTKWGDVDA